MKDTRTKFGIVFTLISVLLIGLVTQNGCKKEKQPAPVEKSAKMDAPIQPAEKTVNTISAAAEIEQTMCPVMDMKINKDVLAEYEGKKVYFCCTECIAKFAEEPEKYAAKLPQFQKPETEHSY